MDGGNQHKPAEWIAVPNRYLVSKWRGVILIIKAPLSPNYNVRKMQVQEMAGISPLHLLGQAEMLTLPWDAHSGADLYFTTQLSSCLSEGCHSAGWLHRRKC